MQLPSPTAPKESGAALKAARAAEFIVKGYPGRHPIQAI